ncbi:dual specificity protein kinase yak1 [Batrachochytrium dendrobatidis]|nr:dual specificity protein kinase yak1 [Batrachochytrium dendrobatidis]
MHNQQPFQEPFQEPSQEPSQKPSQKPQRLSYNNESNSASTQDTSVPTNSHRSSISNRPAALILGLPSSTTVSGVLMSGLNTAPPAYSTSGSFYSFGAPLPSALAATHHSSNTPASNEFRSVYNDSQHSGPTSSSNPVHSVQSGLSFEHQPTDIVSNFTGNTTEPASPSPTTTSSLHELERRRSLFVAKTKAASLMVPSAPTITIDSPGFTASTLDNPNLNVIGAGARSVSAVDSCVTRSGSSKDRAMSNHSSISTPGVAKGFLSFLSFKSNLAAFSHIQPIKKDPSSSGSMPSLTTRLSQYLILTYSRCSPQFTYQQGNNPRRVLTKPSKPVHNDGFDNEDYDYILYVNDILGLPDSQQYQILDILGQGTFGQVVKCENTKTKELVAVKVIKNKPAYYNQSLFEVTILEMLNKKHDKEDKHHLVRMKDTFLFRNHLCIIFEMLSVNLYELIKQNQFHGLSTNLVRVFVTQILDGLIVLSRAGIIHCDLKPENILLKNLESPAIKIIDFGSACHENQTVYTYIQSRFYRSPEVLLGLPYTSSIDMWSVGCIAAELFLGLPLFPGSSEYNQIARIVEMLGIPPGYMCERSRHALNFFDKHDGSNNKNVFSLKSMESYMKERGTVEQPSKRYFKGTTLPEIINTYPVMRKLSPEEVAKETANRLAFIDFLQGLLNLNPLERWSPQQAKQHPFLTGEKFMGRFEPSRSRPASSIGVSGGTTVTTTLQSGEVREIRGTRPRAATIGGTKVQTAPPQLQKLAAISQQSGDANLFRSENGVARNSRGDGSEHLERSGQQGKQHGSQANRHQQSRQRHGGTGNAPQLQPLKIPLPMSSDAEMLATFHQQTQSQGVQQPSFPQSQQVHMSAIMTPRSSTSQFPPRSATLEQSSQYPQPDTDTPNNVPPQGQHAHMLQVVGNFADFQIQSRQSMHGGAPLSAVQGSSGSNSLFGPPPAHQNHYRRTSVAGIPGPDQRGQAQSQSQAMLEAELRYQQFQQLQQQQARHLQSRQQSDTAGSSPRSSRSSHLNAHHLHNNPPPSPHHRTMHMDVYRQTSTDSSHAFPFRKAQSHHTITGNLEPSMSATSSLMPLPPSAYGGYHNGDTSRDSIGVDGHPHYGNMGERHRLPSRIPSAANSTEWEPFDDMRDVESIASFSGSAVGSYSGHRQSGGMDNYRNSDRRYSQDHSMESSFAVMGNDPRPIARSTSYSQSQQLNVSDDDDRLSKSMSVPHMVGLPTNIAQGSSQQHLSQSQLHFEQLQVLSQAATMLEDPSIQKEYTPNDSEGQYQPSQSARGSDQQPNGSYILKMVNNPSAPSAIGSPGMRAFFHGGHSRSFGDRSMQSLYQGMPLSPLGSSSSLSQRQSSNYLNGSHMMDALPTLSASHHPPMPSGFLSSRRSSQMELMPPSGGASAGLHFVPQSSSNTINGSSYSGSILPAQYSFQPVHEAAAASQYRSSMSQLGNVSQDGRSSLGNTSQLSLSLDQLGTGEQLANHGDGSQQDIPPYQQYPFQ